MLRPLRETAFRRVISAFFLSNFGLWFFTIGAPWALYNIFHSPLGVAVGYAVTFAPQVGLSVFGGSLADRFPRRLLLVLSDVISAAAMVGAASVIAFHLSPYTLYVAMLLVASMQALYHPAFQAILPSSVGHGSAEVIGAASTLSQGVQNLTSVAGPALAGVLIASVGAEGSFAANAVLFAAAATLNATTVARNHDRHPSSPSFLRLLAEGFHYVWASPTLRIGSILFFGVNIGAGAVESLVLYLLRQRFGAGADAVGLVYAAQGLASLAVMPIVRPLKSRVGTLAAVFVACLALGLGNLALGASRVLWVAIGGVVIAQAGAAMAATQWFTYRLETVPDMVLGRVVAITRTASFLPVPFAIIAGGVLAGAEGVGAVIEIAALVTVAATVSLWLWAKSTVGAPPTAQSPEEQSPEVPPA